MLTIQPSVGLLTNNSFNIYIDVYIGERRLAILTVYVQAIHMTKDKVVKKLKKADYRIDWINVSLSSTGASRSFTDAFQCKSPEYTEMEERIRANYGVVNNPSVSENFDPSDVRVGDSIDEDGLNVSRLERFLALHPAKRDDVFHRFKDQDFTYGLTEMLNIDDEESSSES